MLLFFFPASEQDKEHCADSHQDGIVKIGHDLHRGDGRHTRRRKQLGSVRDHALSHGSENIKQRRAAPGGDMELIADLFGDWTCHNDCHRIVGGTAVHKENKKRDSELAAFRAVDPLFDHIEDILDSSVFPHESHDRRHNDGDLLTSFKTS